jgi:hypothetical protein
MKLQIRAKRAFEALQKLGAPVYHLGEGWSGNALFAISGEQNYDEIWADYYNEFNLSCLDDFGINKKINNVLKKYGLFAEWCNAGVLDVYEG